MNLKNKIIYLVFIFLYSSAVNANSPGEALYMKNCLICHADDGTGAMPGVRDLQQNREWILMDENKLLARLKQGIQSSGAGMAMPAKGGNQNLTDKDLKEIISYMRKSFFQ